MVTQITSFKLAHAAERRPLVAGMRSPVRSLAIAVFIGYLLGASGASAQQFLVQPLTIRDTQVVFTINVVGTGDGNHHTVTQRQSYTASAPFQQFDQALGHLDGVFVRLTGHAYGEYSGQVLSYGTSFLTLGVNANIDNAFKLDVPGLGSVTADARPNATDELSPFHPSCDLFLPLQQGDSGLVSVPDITSYVGTGTLGLGWTIDITTETTVSNGGVLYQFGDVYGSEVDLVYQYTPIPEPSTLSLLLLFGTVAPLAVRRN